ncbi:pectin methylesterase [Penicillium sp. IBT 16267x]|nr:pectin methylesterase [Penicillium sp. IBT 16267x]
MSDLTLIHAAPPPTPAIVNVTHNISATGDGDKTATIGNSAAASRIYNINVANTHGPGQQAVALSATGTQQGYYGCQFIGCNGTVRTQVGGTSLFARVWFEQVDIKVRSSTKSGDITANDGDSSNDPSYYVIHNPTIKGTSESVKRNSSFLERWY